MVESKGEKACRKYFEKRFGKEFVRIRPNFLKYPPTGRNLELDGYCEDLNLAFEYNGKQHYKYTKRFHGENCEKFHDQVSRDNFKGKKCAELGIRLIIVPDLDEDELKQFIDVEFEKKKDRMCYNTCYKSGCKCTIL